jgi:hypothetical protein
VVERIWNQVSFACSDALILDGALAGINVGRCDGWVGRLNNNIKPRAAPGVLPMLDLLSFVACVDVLPRFGVLARGVGLPI